VDNYHEMTNKTIVHAINNALFSDQKALSFINKVSDQEKVALSEIKQI